MSCSIVNEEEAIQGLNGKYFRLWKFTASHDCLTVALDSSGSGDKLLFFFCERLNINNAFEIQKASLVKNINTLIFKTSNVEIECQEIHRVTKDNKSVWCMNFVNGEFSCREVELGN